MFTKHKRLWGILESKTPAPKTECPQRWAYPTQIIHKICEKLVSFGLTFWGMSIQRWWGVIGNHEFINSFFVCELCGTFLILTFYCDLWVQFLGTLCNIFNLKMRFYCELYVHFLGTFWNISYLNCCWWFECLNLSPRDVEPLGEDQLKFSSKIFHFLSYLSFFHNVLTGKVFSLYVG